MRKKIEMNNWSRFLQVWRLIEEGIYQRPATEEIKIRAAFNRYLKVTEEEAA